jgi:hypothetical protein
MRFRISKAIWILTVAVVALSLLWVLLIFRDESLPWWKGNLHSHSLWSDGDQFPEMITDWYKRHGYHFLALSDHDVLAEGERWLQVRDDPRADEVLASYVNRFGAEWAGLKKRAGGVRVLRLKTLEEYRGLFEEEGRFLIIQAEEITGMFDQVPVHVNATNIRELIQPQSGGSVREVLQNNVDAVLEQRQRTGQTMFPHVPHPNFNWLVTAEDLIELDGDRFFEVYNGYPDANNDGDDLHPSTERIWDIVLTERLARGKDVVYAMAVDDAHQYHAEGPRQANPGRGWVMVRAANLTADSIIAAMEAGDFYATTGVELADVDLSDEAIALSIRPENGVSYVTRFIGTRRGYRPGGEPLDAPGIEGASVPRRYGDDLGVVLAELEGASPRYILTGDEIYVRAKVISSKVKVNAHRSDEHEAAWTQPFVPAR